MPMTVTSQAPKNKNLYKIKWDMKCVENFVDSLKIYPVMQICDQFFSLSLSLSKWQRQYHWPSKSILSTL